MIARGCDRGGKCLAVEGIARCTCGERRTYRTQRQTPWFRLAAVAAQWAEERNSFVWKRPFRNRNQTPPGKKQPTLFAEAVGSSQAGSRRLAPLISACAFCFQALQLRRSKKNVRS